MQRPAVHPPSGAAPAPEADTCRPGSPATAARPVFLDPSGRRQRRVRRLGRLLVIPAVGYVALLLSAAFGGPSVDSPYLPLPVAGDRGAGPATTGPMTTGPTTAGTASRTPSARHSEGAPGYGSPIAHATAGGAPTAGVSPRPTAAGSSSAPGFVPAPGSASPSATAVPTVTHGKSTATHPVPTHTGHGHG